MLLIFSSGIILYSSLFSSAESAFLLSTPAPADQVFAYKFQGAVAFSSWAFVLLGSPVLIAYGMAIRGPWCLLPLAAALFPGLRAAARLPRRLVLPAGRQLPAAAPQTGPRPAAVLLVLAAFGLWVYRLLGRQTLGRRHEPRFRASGCSDQLAIAQGPLAPNHWMSARPASGGRGRT